MAWSAVLFVAAAALAACLAQHASAAPAATAWAAIRAADSLAVSEAVLSQFPHLPYALQDPGFTGTLLLPTDGAWLKLIEVNTTQQAIARIVSSLIPATSKLSLDAYGSSQFYWQAISYHIVVGQALKVADLRAGKAFPTALGKDASFTVEPGSSPAKGVVLRGDQNSARVAGTLWQGRTAVLHVLDTVLLPSIAPTDWLDPIGDFMDNFYPSFYAILNAAAPAARAAVLATPLLQPTTLFLPTDAAVARYLAARKTTLQAFLRDRAACTALAQAHVLKGARLWLWDLLSNAALRRAAGAGQSLPAFLNGAPLQVAAVGLGSQVALLGPKGVRAVVTAPVDLGGNPFGCTTALDDLGQCDGDQASAVHVVDHVLLAA